MIIITIKKGLKILSKNNILRCQGRLKNAPITPITKLPILINRNYYLAKLLQCVKSVRNQSYSGLVCHFPTFELSQTDRVWEKCGPEQLRIRTLFTQ